MKLAFLHIPKTGGCTMTNLCQHFYRPDRCHILVNYASPQVPQNARFIHGHFPYDSFAPHEERLVFTLLREPAARIASYYQMCLKSRPEHWPQYSLFWYGDEAMHILDFANNKINMTSQVDNAMVRQLVSHEVLVANRPITEDDYELAIHNLSRLMVGFTEDYDSFVDSLCDLMEWEKPDYYPIVNKSMPYHVENSILEEIRAINQWDVKLYQWAKRNLND